MKYKLDISVDANKEIRSIRDVSIRKIIRNRIDFLIDHPFMGKPLSDELTGYRALRAYRNRYRIIYRIEQEIITVLIVKVGLRKGIDRNDVYQTLKRQFKRYGKTGIGDN